MATKHIIDTRSLVWFLEDNPRLGAKARAVLLNPGSILILPGIVLAEACWIVGRGRTTIPAPADLLTAVDADPRLILFPLDRAVINRSLALASIEELHSRQIVATALVLRDRGETVALLTQDPSIVASGLVPVVW